MFGPSWGPWERLQAAGLADVPTMAERATEAWQHAAQAASFGADPAAHRAAARIYEDAAAGLIDEDEVRRRLDAAAQDETKRADCPFWGSGVSAETYRERARGGDARA